MVAQNTDEIIRELDRTPAAPVQFEHPRTHARYVLISQEAYQRVRPLLESAEPANGDAAVEWNEEKNARRCDLIDRDYAGGLSADEEAELATLQDEMYRHRAQVAPLPLEMLELLKEALENRAAKSQAAAAS